MKRTVEPLQDLLADGGSTWRMVRFTMIVFLDKPVSRVTGID